MWCQNKAIKGGGRLVFQVTVVVATSEVMILMRSLREEEKVSGYITAAVAS